MFEISTERLREVEVKVVFGLNSNTPFASTAPPCSPLTHLTDWDSKPRAPVWNQHWTCRKWEISTGDRGGREGGGGDKRKTAKWSADLTFGKPPLSISLSHFLSPYLLLRLVSPSFCLRLREHLLAVCVRACSCACVHIAKTLKGSPYERLRACCFFPGTVIRRLSQESGQAASYFSRA